MRCRPSCAPTIAMAVVTAERTASADAMWVTAGSLASSTVPMNALTMATVSRELACALPAFWESTAPLQVAAADMELAMTQELAFVMQVGTLMTAL